MSIRYFRYQQTIALSIPALLLLSGCGDTRPECDSSDTRGAVVKIVAGDSNNALANYAAKNSAGVQEQLKGASTEVEKQAILEKARQVVSYRLGDEITTNSKSKDKRVLTCTGSLSATLRDTAATKAVDFKVEQTPDGNISVSVSPFQFDRGG